MEETFLIQELKKRVAQSELGYESINDPLMKIDIWPVTELGYTEEESKITGIRNIHFKDFCLEPLKLLAKLTIRTSAREKSSLSVIRTRSQILKQLDKFLVSKGISQVETLTDSVCQEFVTGAGIRTRQGVMTYAIKLWSEEKWLKIAYNPRNIKKPNPKIETIPEEVLYQVYANFDLFPPPLERLFRLQFVLGWRIGEILKIPRQCLKQEDGQYFLLKWVAKRKHWEFISIHFLVAELVKEQQKFLDAQLGSNSSFDKLFCKISTAYREGATSGTRFTTKPLYRAEFMRIPTICRWLNEFSDVADLKDKYGQRFYLTSHMFRRTKFSIMAYCETEDEFIAAIAGHGSLDMLPHYRQRSLERLEKDAQIRGYVDMYGQLTTFKPKKRRYEKLADFLKVSTSLGECHRPTMLGDCQYRYACLNCIYHRVTLEDKLQLENDLQQLQQDLEQSQKSSQDRRVTEINRLLNLVQTRLQGLENLNNLRVGKNYGY